MRLPICGGIAVTATFSELRACHHHSGFAGAADCGSWQRYGKHIRIIFLRVGQAVRTAGINCGCSLRASRGPDSRATRGIGTGPEDDDHLMSARELRRSVLPSVGSLGSAGEQFDSTPVDDAGRVDLLHLNWIHD